jgi:hypothetical protein
MDTITDTGTVDTSTIDTVVTDTVPDTTVTDTVVVDTVTDTIASWTDQYDVGVMNPTNAVADNIVSENQAALQDISTVLQDGGEIKYDIDEADLEQELKKIMSTRSKDKRTFKISMINGEPVKNHTGVYKITANQCPSEAAARKATRRLVKDLNLKSGQKVNFRLQEKTQWVKKIYRKEYPINKNNIYVGSRITLPREQWKELNFPKKVKDEAKDGGAKDGTKDDTTGAKMEKQYKKYNIHVKTDVASKYNRKKKKSDKVGSVVETKAEIVKEVV